MILLGIDTCGSVGTLALARVGSSSAMEPLGSAELPGRSAAAGLVPAIRQMLFEAGVALDEVAGLVVVDGPGSFTGIRIGLSTAKALAEARALPLYAISRLRVLASTHHACCAILDAGRGEFYFGSYSAGEEAAFPPAAASSREDTASLGEWLCTQGELAERVAEGAAGSLVACEPKVADALPGAWLVAPPVAADALRTALPDVLAGRQAHVEGLDGRYLRRSDLYRTLQATL